MNAPKEIKHQDDVVKIIWRTRLTANEKHVLMRYVKAGPLQDGRLANVFISIQKVSRELSMGVSTIEKVRRSLKKKGLIREVGKSERHENIKNAHRQSQVEVMIPNLIALALTVESKSSPLSQKVVTPPREGCTSNATPLREGLTNNVNNNKNNNNSVGASPVVSSKGDGGEEEKPETVHGKIRDRLEVIKKQGKIPETYKDFDALVEEVEFHVANRSAATKSDEQALCFALKAIKNNGWSTPRKMKAEQENAYRESQRQTGTWFDPGCSRVEESEEDNEAKRLASLPPHIREKLMKESKRDE